MYKEANRDLWTGRVDIEDAELGKRWHEKIEFLSEPYEAKQGVAFLGFECDEGVKRNKGRVGAAEGADTLKQAMGNFAYHLNKTPLYDAGKVVASTDLEQSQKELSLHVNKLLKQNHFPIVLGGGHEVAYGSFMGLYNSLGEDKNIAVINFDAHFDLRQNESATSGTPFAQMAFTCKEDNQEFNYLCLGVSKASNTKALFAKAEALHVEYILDTKMTFQNIEMIKEKIDAFLSQKEHIYITIDTDVFYASQVPAVSAVSARGIDINLTYELLEYIFVSYKNRVRLVDIAEFSPKYDINDIGKKAVSRLVFDLVELVEQ
ncbi:formimidoylglutamase [Sulfurospirillum arcachonense]|uniref:formimidoylglutamase n=1 Tax=Sulfurospirillum arcachonense TaxID=57666 RepID=UPI0004B874A0|nr:formimidoylglutamase [Sulfurospirillum arcachonense]